MTLDDAKRIQRQLRLTDDAFSMKLGFSARAFYQAKKRKTLSRWMQREIAMRYGRMLSEVR